MKKTYKVLTPVSHDNEDYAPGAALALEEKAAESLLVVKAIEEAPAEEAAKTPAKK